MNGHWYVGLRSTATLERVEIAIPAPAVDGSLAAVEAAQRACPGWVHLPGDITWRAAFHMRPMPANSSPDYQAASKQPRPITSARARELAGAVGDYEPEALAA